jgi:hypothetical protein
MSYRHLALNCACGEPPEHIDEVGFTDEHDLVIHWWCSQCRRVVYTTKPLADCWHECPQPKEEAPQPKVKSAPPTYKTDDLVFLRALGIRLT